jgi:ribosome-associated protein
LQAEPLPTPVTPESRHPKNSTSPNAGLPPAMNWAVEAAQSKKASGITVLDLRELKSFTDAFLLCSGASAPQVQAIADAIEEAMERRGMRTWHREGRGGAEWLLLDYGFCIVHVFHDRARHFYDLERLWRSARRIDIPDADANPNSRMSGAREE